MALNADSCLSLAHGSPTVMLLTEAWELSIIWLYLSVRLVVNSCWKRMFWLCVHILDNCLMIYAEKPLYAKWLLFSVK